MITLSMKDDDTVLVTVPNSDAEKEADLLDVEATFMELGFVRFLDRLRAFASGEEELEHSAGLTGTPSDEDEEGDDFEDDEDGE